MTTTNGFARKAALAAAAAVFVAFFGTCPGAAAQGTWEEDVNWNRAERTTPVQTAAPASRTELPARTAPAPADDPGWIEEHTGGWISERLTIGLAVSRLHLTANRRSPSRDSGKTFVGFVNLLELEDETAWAPVITYWVARYLRVSATWEDVKASAYNYDKGNIEEHAHADGTVKVSGPVLSLEAVWPCLDDTLFPHVGGGVFFANGDFSESSFWYLGYSSQDSYETYGSPTTTRARYTREIHVDNDIGWLASAGIAWRPFKHFQLDLDVRQTWIDVDCEFGYMKRSGWEPHRTGDFSLDNTAWTLSAAFVF